MSEYLEFGVAVFVGYDDVFLFKVRYPLLAVPHGDVSPMVVFDGRENYDVAGLIAVVMCFPFLFLGNAK